MKEPKDPSGDRDTELGSGEVSPAVTTGVIQISYLPFSHAVILKYNCTPGFSDVVAASLFIDIGIFEPIILHNNSVGLAHTCNTDAVHDSRLPHAIAIRCRFNMNGESTG